jgi:hypothetical protein
MVKAVWENLGRVVAEYPHLPGLKRSDSGPGWEITGEAILRELAEKGGPAIFVSGHIANWELLPPVVGHFGISMSAVYRAPTNPLIDRMILGFREAALAPIVAPLFPKGAEGARATLAHLRRGGFLGMLLDQKMNDGIAARLFGERAMTAPALAQLAPGDAHRACALSFRIRATLAAARQRRPDGRCRCSDAGGERHARALDPRPPGRVAVAAPPLRQGALPPQVMRTPRGPISDPPGIRRRGRGSGTRRAVR